MGNLTENAIWPAGVPYFEADSVLTGGPDCPDNLPIQALANRTAFLKKQIDDAVSGTLKVMYANRLTTARTITMSGDGSWVVSFDGNGNVTAAMTLTNTAVVPGTWPMTTVDSKGRVTAGRALVEADLPALSWAKITSGKPTTLAGYGITDAQPLDSDLTALAALTTTGFYVNTGVGTVAARTLTAGAGISISNGDGVAANPVITNTGVTSLAGTANQVNVSAATGGITLSLPQAIHTAAKPSFAQVALAADPVNALDAATKQYVDNLAAGLEVKTSVRAATTANITLSGVQTVDGVAVVTGDRVLVKNQATASQNGIYLVSAVAWTRATDADVWAELISAFVFVENGTTNADTGWVCTVDQGGTLGTTSINWTQFAGAGTVTAGPGLSVSGNQVSLAAGGNLLSLHNLAGTGMVVRTGSGTLVARTLTAGAGISVSNSDGYAGNPTFSLSPSGVTAGTYPKVTVDSYGRATGGAALVPADIPPLDFSKITSGLPTTLEGYGITVASTAEAAAGGDATKPVTSKGIRHALNASGAAPIYAARAWLNFNGTGTVAIRSSGNVSSITDNGTGDYTVNFTTAMPDANFAVALGGNGGTDPIGGVNCMSSGAKTTTSVRVSTTTTTAGRTDFTNVELAVFC